MYKFAIAALLTVLAVSQDVAPGGDREFPHHRDAIDNTSETMNQQSMDKNPEDPDPPVPVGFEELEDATEASKKEASAQDAPVEQNGMPEEDEQVIETSGEDTPVKQNGQPGEDESEQVRPNDDAPVEPNGTPNEDESERVTPKKDAPVEPDGTPEEDESELVTPKDDAPVEPNGTPNEDESERVTPKKDAPVESNGTPNEDASEEPAPQELEPETDYHWPAEQEEENEWSNQYDSETEIDNEPWEQLDQHNDTLFLLILAMLVCMLFIILKVKLRSYFNDKYDKEEYKRRDRKYYAATRMSADEESIELRDVEHYA